jgi:hypothetical protein
MLECLLSKTGAPHYIVRSLVIGFQLVLRIVSLGPAPGLSCKVVEIQRSGKRLTRGSLQAVDNCVGGISRGCP